MGQSIQSLIAASVHRVLRQRYPDEYFSLCHAHAVVGANVISLVLGRVYRPVAGLAVFKCGPGQFIRLTDNAAFANPQGGAFHCWIESADPSFAHKELVDFTFRHNREYAINNGLDWTGPPPPDYLWGDWRELVIKGEPETLPASFRCDQVWLRETDEGWDWMTRHLAENMNAYVALTADVLRMVQASLPADSTLLPLAISSD